ncbi:ribulose-phosphate 3-epimerase [Vagococcus sp. BWB3-3]|uniref:Ribulose-phosphate 3-epimerase n=1 Tax=Vagococcus allomyrinae TaxID=2794353 RepID=A0A940SR27_9ENTE|nr:ribulose-phosphate 3-epimerase [Vagococcus allomyrinae]MBP1040347.1 ribulose-phosphate 3-epimerase [Vagococcus allomyrinae]
MVLMICPSLMCADFGNLEQEVKLLEAAGSDIFHVDIMDGRFVPNFGMGLQDFDVIRKTTTKLVDVHLMIEQPGDYVAFFADKGADIIYFHPEADTHPTRTIDKIRQKKKGVGIAINPGTSIEVVRELLPLIDYLMVMTVNPGFAGQSYLASVTDKLRRLTEIKHQHNWTFHLMVDGAISEEKIRELNPLGVEGFVLGTSTLFNQAEAYAEIIQRLKK